MRRGSRVKSGRSCSTRSTPPSRSFTRLIPPHSGLSDFGRPQGYVARQIKRWSEQYRASETEAIPEMDQLIAWLPGACPADSGAAIVHGDFRLDNCIIHPTEPRIIAVLDWELSTHRRSAGGLHLSPDAMVDASI